MREKCTSTSLSLPCGFNGKTKSRQLETGQDAVDGQGVLCASLCPWYTSQCTAVVASCAGPVAFMQSPGSSLLHTRVNSPWICSLEVWDLPASHQVWSTSKWSTSVSTVE